MNKTRITAYLLACLVTLLSFSACGKTPAAPVDPSKEDPQPPGPQKPEVLRILAIGNSFTEDAVEQNLYELLDSAGIKAVTANCYIGGCTLETHWKNEISTDKKNTNSYRKIVDGQKTTTANVSIEYILKDEPWNYVIFQQGHGYYGLVDTHYPYLDSLVNYVGRFLEKGTYKVGYQLNWAFPVEPGTSYFAYYGNDQMTMYKACVDCARTLKQKSGLDIIIPTGTAIQNGRTTALGDTFNRDWGHLEKTYGRYTAACTWFEAITGLDVRENGYYPMSVGANLATMCRKFAHDAVQNPYSITSDGPIPPGPVNPDPSKDGVVGSIPCYGYKATYIFNAGTAWSVKGDEGVTVEPASGSAGSDQIITVTFPKYEQSSDRRIGVSITVADTTGRVEWIQNKVPHYPVFYRIYPDGYSRDTKYRCWPFVEKLNNGVFGLYTLSAINPLISSQRLVLDFQSNAKDATGTSTGNFSYNETGFLLGSNSSPTGAYIVIPGIEGKKVSRFEFCNGSSTQVNTISITDTEGNILKGGEPHRVSVNQWAKAANADKTILINSLQEEMEMTPDAYWCWDITGSKVGESVVVRFPSRAFIRWFTFNYE
ncbi:MAG: DUF4886 domain-containing protein [Bacteroidales bacterium]|nr:DUF4886 domain-containing protein [Bacteroidales bacterium]